MNERLKELLRQRQLIQDHLGWLDRQLTAESGGAGGPTENANPVPVPLVAPPPHASHSPGAIPTSEALPIAAVDPLLEQYHQEPDTLKADVKRGCLIYFSVAMGVLLLAVFFVYLHYAHRKAAATSAAPVVTPAPAVLPAHKP